MKFLSLVTFCLFGTAALSWAGLPELKGEWKSECYGLPKRHSIVFAAAISDSKLKVVSQLYAESGFCKTLNLTLILQGSFSTGSSFGEGIEIDLTPLSVVVVLKNPDVVKYYNKKRACGFSDWALEAPKELVGKSCDPSIIPVAEGTAVDIYGLRNGLLYFGKFPFVSESSRPAKLNMAFGLKKSTAEGSSP